MIFKLLAYYISLHRWQMAGIESVKKMQLRKFRRLFEHAKENSQFYNKLYREAGVFDLEIKTFEDIKKIPVIDKTMLKNHNHPEILTVLDKSSLTVHTTSGSSGEPFAIYQTKFEDYTAHVRVFNLLREFGYNPFKKITMITRYDKDEQFEVEKDISIISKIQKRLKILEREIISIYEEPEYIAQKIINSKPYILWTTPSVLDMVCNTLISNKTRLSIPYVVLTSETILPHQLEKFNSYISKNIIGHYGLMEAPTISYDVNNSGNKNIFASSFLVEYTDIKENDGKITGTPVITNFINKTMPFIRYNTHDTGEVLSDKGFSHKTMGRIAGRLDDILDLPDGTKFVHHHAYEMFMDFIECDQFKFEQKGNGSITLNLKPNRNYDTGEIRSKAEERWKKRFPDFPLVIEFREKFSIDPKTGKFKNIEKIK